MTARLILGIPSPDDDRPGMFVRTPFDQELVDGLKTLPFQDRRWVRHEAVWWVASDHLDYVEALMRSRFGPIEVVDEDGVVEYRDRDGSSSTQATLF